MRRISSALPYVTVKIAESLDGKIATWTGDSRWVTSEDARRFVHRLRSRTDAVMVGVNTVIADDPLLLSGLAGAKQPVRVVVDSRLRTPLTAKLFSRPFVSQVIIATVKNPRNRRRSRLYKARGAGVLALEAKGGRVDLRRLLEALAGAGIRHLLVEGGAELAWGLASERLVDRFLFFIAPKIVGGTDAVSAVGGRGVRRMSEAIILKKLKIKRFKDDILIEAEAKRCSQA